MNGTCSVALNPPIKSVVFLTTVPFSSSCCENPAPVVGLAKFASVIA